MPFFENLRRRKGGSKTEKLSNGTNSPHAGSTGTVKTTKSSSTLNSLYGSSTPPSTIQPQTSTPNLMNGKSMNGSVSALPQRPLSLGLSGNRNSVIVCHSFSHSDPPPARKMIQTNSLRLGYERCAIYQRSIYPQNANFGLCTTNNFNFRKFLGTLLKKLSLSMTAYSVDLGSPEGSPHLRRDW